MCTASTIRARARPFAGTRRLRSAAERRTQNGALSAGLGTVDVDELSGLENGVRATPPRSWRKGADAPLGQVVALKLRRRRESVGAKLARRRKRNEA